MNIDLEKGQGLVPAIIQDEVSGQILMLGYMNEEALAKTKKEGKVCFYSRSKERLWTKGETSGNFLLVKDIQLDCDNDTLLIKAEATVPVCHTGSLTCFKDDEPRGTIYKLARTIEERKVVPVEGSYTSHLFEKGMNKIAQKVGEEATEMIIEAKDDNDELFLNEAADLMYHYLVLLSAKGFSIQDVEATLRSRMK